MTSGELGWEGPGGNREVKIPRNDILGRLENHMLLPEAKLRQVLCKGHCDTQ